MQNYIEQWACLFRENEKDKITKEALESAVRSFTKPVPVMMDWHSACYGKIERVELRSDDQGFYLAGLVHTVDFSGVISMRENNPASAKLTAAMLTISPEVSRSG